MFIAHAITVPVTVPYAYLAGSTGYCTVRVFGGQGGGGGHKYIYRAGKKSTVRSAYENEYRQMSQNTPPLRRGEGGDVGTIKESQRRH